MTLRAIIFDVGETLIDETRLWGRWADRLGVSRLTFFACLGAVIARGEPHRRVFELVHPGFDLAAAQRDASEPRDPVGPEDFYPDALSCLRALRAGGYRLGIAGNQPREAEDALVRLGLPVDFVASSAGWGVEKPSPAFFARVVEAAGLPPREIAYVGDRLDNDVLPAIEAGLIGIFLPRGPWGLLHAEWPEAARAHLRLESLGELPKAIAGQ